MNATRRRQFWMALGLAVFLPPLAALPAALVKLYVVNSASAPALLPAKIEAVNLGLKAGNYRCAKAAVDIVKEGDRTFVYLGVYPRAFGAEVVTLEETDTLPDVPLMPVVEKGKNLQVQTARGIWELGPQGIVSFSEGKKVFPLKPQLAGEHSPVKSFQGANLVKISLISAKGKTVYTIYKKGMMEIVTDAPFNLDPVSEQATTWHWGPNNLTATYHLDTAPFPFEPPNDPQSGIAFNRPGQWAMNLAEDNMGLWISRGGVALVCSQEEAYLKERRSVPFPRTVNHYYCYFAIPAKAAFLLGPAGSTAEGKVNYWGTSPSLVFLKAGQEFSARGDFNRDGRDERVAIEDRNRNGAPDTAGDRWFFYGAGEDKNPAMVYSFGLWKDDPFKEGNFCYVSQDLNGNNQMEASELERPTFKFVDWSHNGAFFTGSLLEGGAIDQDCFYFSAKGSAQQAVWDEKHMAYDLDGDGNHELWYSAEGQDRGWVTTTGTASGTSTLMINYAHRDYAYVLLVNPFKGTTNKSRSCHIGYDYYFFSDNACATTMPVTEQGFYAPWEEHMEYEGFAPYGQAHLWTFAGDLGRVIWGELGGQGCWKLGVGPGPGETKTAWAKARWKPLTYTDPWGHSLKIMSYLMPQRWKGEALKVRKLKDGGYDYIDRGAWAWCTTFNGSSTTCIEEEGNPGEGAFEAYVNVHGPWGRVEEAKDGKTTFFFYYSPLAGGLHHRGISDGRCQGVSFLYQDRDEDGIVDTYIYDKEKDNYFEKRCWYNPQNDLLQFFDEDKLCLWFKKYQFPGYKMLLENYMEIDKLYRRGYKEDPLLLRAKIAADGTLVLNEDIPFYLTFTKEWFPTVVALDSFHSRKEGYGWQDPGAGGIPGDFRSAFAFAFPTVFARVTEPFSARSLAGVDLLIINNLAQMLTTAELNSLKEWVSQGGKLILNLSTEEPAELDAFNSVAGPFGLQLEEEFLDADLLLNRIPDQSNITGDVVREMKPRKVNRVAFFQDLSGANLLRYVNYLAYRGYPVKALADKVKPLLLHQGKVILAETDYGRGKVFLCGANLLSNRYISSPTEERYGDNATFMKNFVRFLSAQSTSFRISSVQSAKGIYDLDLEGKGGDMLIAARSVPLTVTVDRQKLSITKADQLTRIPIPGGKKVHIQIAGF